MRLTSLYIGEYKNLRDFSLSFDGDSCIEVFVGKNGTGKSNLFEALIEIFRHLIEYERDKAACDFNGQKVAFAKDLVPTLATACFEVFRPKFDFRQS